MTPAAGGRRRIVLPRRFYEDHVLRDLPAGEVIGTTAAGLIVLLDAEAEADLLADARFYAEAGTREFGPDMLGLIASARATIRRIEAAQ